MTRKLAFVLANLVLLIGFLPAFAEVTELQLDKNSYMHGESLDVKGTVSNDSSGLVSIVFRNPDNKFVLLSQAFIQDDNSFEKIIPINEKFQIVGNHNATAFVLNMTAGKTQSFNIVSFSTEKELDSKDSLPEDTQFSDNMLKANSSHNFDFLENNSKPENNQIPKNSPNNRAEEKVMVNKLKIAGFVDTTKDPQYYLDRYYNEPMYKLWFDRNYPNLTIEEAVGYEESTEEFNPDYENVGTGIIPQAEALSMVPSSLNSKSNSEDVKVAIVLGGLGILFVAVYGVKRRVESNTKLFSFTRPKIKPKITFPRINPNPIRIIQTRLATGEISIEEYGRLKKEFEKND